MKTRKYGRKDAIFPINVMYTMNRIRMRGAAMDDFEDNRINGCDDDARGSLPKDGKYTWIKGKVEEDYVYGVKRADGGYDYEVRYDAGPRDIAWMEERDRNYISRLLRDGTKTEVERADLEEVKTKPEFRKLYQEALKQYEAISPEIKLRKEQERLAAEQQRLAEQRAQQAQRGEKAAQAAKEREAAERSQREQERLRAEQTKKEAEEKQKAEQVKIQQQQVIKQNYRTKGIVVCAQEGNLHAVDYLLGLDSTDVNVQDAQGKTALHQAILAGKNDVAQVLINNPKVNLETLSEEGRTALHYASMQGNLDMVKLLVSKKINVFAKDGLDKTARDLAVGKEHAAIAMFLKNVMPQNLSNSPSPKAPPAVNFNLPSGSGSSSGVSSGSSRSSTPAAISDEARRLQASYLIDYSKLTFGETLGKGGFGIVCKGTYSHSEVAIKKLLVDNMTAATENEFKNETSIMANSRHPNIVILYGYTLSPYCMVMELMSCTLFKLLHNGQDLPWSLRFSIAKDIAAGLAHLHDNQIIHRDMKSLNVLLSDTGRAKLTDFGLSKLRSETKTTTKVSEGSVWTIQWMAPELFGLKPKYSAKSDIYAYGMVMWELTTGEIPYKDAQPDEIRLEVKQGNREEIPEDPEECPAKMASLIKFCWMQEASKRPDAHKIAEYLQSGDEEFKDDSAVASSSYRCNLDSSMYRGNLSSVG